MKALLTSFLPNLLPGLGALVNPWVIIAVLAAAAGCFLAGMHLQTQLFESVHAHQLEIQITKIAAFGARQRTENAALADNLNSETTKRRDSERKLAEALRRTSPSQLVEDSCQDAPGAVAKPNPAPMAGEVRDVASMRVLRLSADGVRLWNERLALGVVDADRRQFVDDANTTAGAVEITDAIQNVADNAALLGECRERELAWQKKACQNKWWAGPECGG